MLSIAARLARVKPSPTLAVTARAAELKAAGKPVIGLGAGEPDFDTPAHIKQAAVDAIAKGDTKYTPVSGTAPLKRAICEKFKRENGLTYTPQDILVSNGAKQVIFNALLATLNPGDEVIIPAPYWVSYPDMVLFAEGVPVVVPCAESDGFKLRPNALAKAITPRTKWLILNAPSNPTGAAYTHAELRALADVLVAHPHVSVIADDIYEHLLYDGLPFHTLAAVAPELHARTLTVNGVSKAFAMTGWRIGYAGGPAPLIAAMTDIQSHSTSNPCSISQAAAVAALTHPTEFLHEWRERFTQRRNLVVRALNAIDGLRCPMPEGAFYVFPNMEGLIGSHTPGGAVVETSSDFCTYLLEHALVATVAGSAFGAEGYFRISTATADSVLEEAMARIAKACTELRR